MRGVLLAVAAAVLFGIGTYLVLQRKLSRIVIGVGLMGHGANVLFVTLGRRGRAGPDHRPATPSRFADPLPQALALTGIVISFGVTALLLALAYRSWLLTHDDEVEDDIEDRIVGPHRPPTAARRRRPGRRSTTPASAEPASPDDEEAGRERAPRPAGRAAAGGGGPVDPRGAVARPAGDRAVDAHRGARPMAVALLRRGTSTATGRRRPGRRLAGAGRDHARRRPALGDHAVRLVGGAAGGAACTPSASPAPSATTSASSRSTWSSRRACRRRSSPATCSTCSWPSR